MKKLLLFLLLTLLPTLVIAQVSGGQITRPDKKQHNNPQANKKVARNGSLNQSIVREIYYESTLSATERALWEEEKAKAKEKMMLLAYNLKRNAISPRGNFVGGLAPCDKGYIDKQGNLAINFSKYWHYEFHNGYARFINGNKYGIIDMSGNTVIPPNYEEIHDCEEGLFCVVNGERSGYINTKGEIIIPLIYDKAGYVNCCISEGLVRVCKDNRYGYVDKMGNNVVSLEYEDAGNFHEGLAPAKKNGKWGYINKHGIIVVPFLYDYASEIHCGLGRVEINRKVGFVDILGNIAIPIKYDKKQNGDYVEPLNNFSDDMACVMENKKYGYINKQGRKVIQCIYKSRHDFSEGLALVQKDDSGKNHGLINKRGQIIAPFKFSASLLMRFRFNEGLMFVNPDGKTHNGYYIDKYGNSTLDFE